MANVNFYAGTATKFAEITKDANTFYLVDGDLYIGSKKITNAADLDAAVTRIGTVEGLLETLNGANTVSGSVKKQIKDAIDALTGSATIASVASGVVTLKAGISEANGVVSNSSDSDITLAKVATTGSASDVAITDTADDFTATTVEGALAELADKVDDAQSAGEIILAHESGSLVYTLYQGAQDASHKIGDISIPNDMVATSGELYTATASDTSLVEGDMYIKMTIANGDPFYIPVNDLIDVYTGTNPASGIKIEVNSGVISASIVTLDGSKLDAGSVAKAKLATGVQSSLDLADSAVQSVAEGATNGTIAVDGTDVAVHGLGSAAYVATTTFDAAGSAATAKSEVMGDSSTDTASSKTIEGLVKKTDATNTLIGTLDTTTYTNVLDYVDKTAAASANISSTAGIASKSGNVVTLKAGLTQTAGAVTNNSDADITLSAVASTGAAVNVSIADAGGKITASDVEGALQEIATNVAANTTALTWQAL